MKDVKENPSSVRKKIVNAARKVFLSKGLAQSKLVDVSKKSGLTPTHIRYHFPEMETLFSEVLREVLDELKGQSVAAIRGQGDPEKKMEAYIRAPFEWASRNPEYAQFWIYFYYQCLRSEEWRKFNTQIRLDGRERIASMLFEGMAKGSFKSMPRAEVLDLALEIQALITGQWVLCFSEENQNPLKNADKCWGAVYQWVRK